ncbi:hypothetical protein BDV95DRAFT_594981 [Massariosphaeria phaeospora]|uniref:Uncharacterized protein n=1 Tax=Massariosphaeria phaeospora TaxID=100035 RepID=A0A7C8M7W3_9PLEO|nr:hypothetical protein BDV95DRAFT_594981 [Massariosphaeria phaeospora]
MISGGLRSASVRGIRARPGKALDASGPKFLRGRWTKKTKEQRKKNLLEAWPAMSPIHRPDFHAFHRDSARQGRNSTGFREAYLWPYINQQNLSSGRTLLLLLNAQGRNPPIAFLYADLESALVGHRTGRSLLAGDGLEALEIQEKLLDFLVSVTKIIMKDKGPDFADESFPVLPPLMALRMDDSEWQSVPALAAQAPYMSPQAVDLLKLKDLVSARLSAAKDHILSLREDPSYFAACVKDWFEHTPYCVPDNHGKVHHHVASAVSRNTYWWETLLLQLDSVIALDRMYIEKQLETEEELPGYVEALQMLKHILIGPMERCFFSHIKEQFPSSPPMRHLFERQVGPNGVVALRYRHAVNRSMWDIKDYLLWLFMVLYQPGSAGRQESQKLQDIGNLAVELERRMQMNPKEKERVTTLLAGTVSDIGLKEELVHQLQRYRPLIFLDEHGDRRMAARERELANGPWADNLDSSLRAISGALMPDEIPLGRRGYLAVQNFKYPNTKRRTKENVALMQSAERNLDALWLKVDQHLQEKLDSTAYQVWARLSPKQDEIRRTEDWCEPEPLRLRADLQIPSVLQDFKELDLERQRRTEETIAANNAANTTPAPKTKSRGLPGPEIPQRAAIDAPEVAPQPTAPPPPRFTLKKRALKVFATIFHNLEQADQPGEIAWLDFLYAMAQTGFAPEKLYGSVWQFTPDAVKFGVERSIQFHEPHPHGKIPYFNAKRIGRRLNRAYGWHGAMFVAE